MPSVDVSVLGPFTALDAVDDFGLTSSLLLFCRVLLSQELEHLVVKAYVVSLEESVRLVSLKVDTEARELLEALGMPGILGHPLLYLLVHRLMDILQEVEALWVYRLICSLITARPSEMLIQK